MPPADRGNKTTFFLLIYFLVSQGIVGGILGARIAAGSDVNLLMITALGLVIGLGVPFVFYLLITKRKWRDILQLNPIGLPTVLVVTVISLAAIPMVHVVSRTAAFVFEPLVMDVLGDLTDFPMWVNLLVIAVFPAIFEEIWFRGAIYKEYEALSIKHRAILTGVFFGVLHMNFHQFTYAALLGVLYAYVLYYTRSIFAPMLMHLLNNAISAFTMFSGPFVEWYDALWEQPGRFYLIIGGAALVMIPVLWLGIKKLKQWYEAKADIPQSEPVHLVPAASAAKPTLMTGAAWAIIVIFIVFATSLEVMMRVDWQYWLDRLLELAERI